MLRKIIVLVSLLLVSRHVASQVCSHANEELLRQRRMQSLRSIILAQLGMTEPPEVDRRDPSPEILEAYNAIAEANLARKRVRDKTCQDRDFYANPVNSFVGTMTPLPINTEEFQSGGSLERRSVQEGEPALKPTNALAMFNLSFPFSLPENQTVVESAQLLLFQKAVDTSEYYTAVEQFVEIVALHDKLGKAIVASKYLNIFESGFQDFDLTSNMKEWLASNHRGPLHLEVSVYCFAPSCTAPNTEGKAPKAVRFLNDPKFKEHAPRIVVTSQNPLEASRNNRLRRQSEGGVGECINNQTTCCLKKLIINFKQDLNFSFIVEPDQYEANYCEGICPIAPGGALMTPRLFQFLSNLDGHPASSVEPCCAGNVYHDFPVIARFADGTEMVLDLKKVQVTSCRCG